MSDNTQDKKSETASPRERIEAQIHAFQKAVIDLARAGEDAPTLGLLVKRVNDARLALLRACLADKGETDDYPTVRDQFAMAALQGAVQGAAHHYEDGKWGALANINHAGAAAYAYSLAEAMMARRSAWTSEDVARITAHNQGGK